MKKSLYLLFVLALCAACSQNEPKTPAKQAIAVFDESKADFYYSYAEMSVPVGVTTLFIETYSQIDAQGHKVDVKTTEVAVNPVPEVPTDGKDVEPFGTVKILFESPVKTIVSVYYKPSEALVNANSPVTNIYLLSDFPVTKISYGTYGVTNYVQLPFDYSWNGIPDDYLFYDETHNHTLRYTYAFAKTGNGDGYVLTDIYEVKDHVVVGIKNSEIDMPWDDPNFGPNGNQMPAAAPKQLTTEPDPEPYMTIQLQEPTPYVSADECQTFYHSSGVVMFEDSWPTANVGGVYDLDFDDVVIDYDLEAKTVDDSRLETEGWREQVKVVLQLRAVGSSVPYRVGVRLEGFDQTNVQSIEQHFTLDSYNNPHGELPAFTQTTIQHMSNHYETDPMNPVVEMAHLHTMNQERAGKGANAEYDYINGDFVNHTVFNLTYGFKPMDESQYDPALASITQPTTLKKIQNQKYYNAIPGYINVSGGLLTYTVIYHMKPRFNMTPEQREAAKQNMIETVTNTFRQNFYIITGDFTPVGLKGYEPVFIHNESVSKYNAKFNTGVENGTLNPSIPYYGTNGNIWGLKCPTLTRHIWNKLYFSQAYPHYGEWVQSNGATHENWYNEDVNELFLVCWW